jgi:hypothetical protein
MEERRTAGKPRSKGEGRERRVGGEEGRRRERRDEREKLTCTLLEERKRVSRDRGQESKASEKRKKWTTPKKQKTQKTTKKGRGEE